MDHRFAGSAQIPSGSTVVAVQATDANGNAATANYQVSSSGSSTTYTYDANGNMTSDGTRTYEWDVNGNLYRVLQSGVELVRYAYDGQGRRSSKVSGGVTYSYINDLEDVLQERVSSGTTIDFVHGPGFDAPLARVQGGVITYLVADHLGSVVAETDTLGQTVLTRSYDPWGQPLTGGANGGYAYASREWEPEVGLYYMRARYYSPTLGRFLSEDPLGRLRVPHIYSYADNSPILLADQTGLQASFPGVNRECSGKGSNAVYVICCYSGGAIGICKGPDPDPSSRYVQKCMIEHEQKHISDLTEREDEFPCDKAKCKYAAQLHCAIAPGNKNDTECSAYCAELTCLGGEPPVDPGVQNRKQQIKGAMSKYCRGKGRFGCI